MARISWFYFPQNVITETRALLGLCQTSAMVPLVKIVKVV